MKLFNQFLIFLSFLICSSSCSNKKITEPEQLGKLVFNILQTINVKGQQDYINNFLSIEEIRELAKNDKVVKNEMYRNALRSMLKEKWIDKITRNYNRLKKNGVNSGIIWQDIQYLDFVYKKNDKADLQGVEGHLHFRYKDRTYQVDISAIWNGKEYLIVEIDDLDEMQIHPLTAALPH